MGVFLLLFLLPIIMFYFPKYLKFQNSTYQQASGNSFLKTMFNKGDYGEFCTFIQLEKLKGHYKLMANLYVPKKDGTTTEIDILLLSETGLYVFESKNYSGWIFGDEKYKNWMQMLPNKQKEPFFNPIWQNQAHINAVKSALELSDDRLFKSYIIFSERCTLKKMNVISPGVKVMKRNALFPTIKREIDCSEKLLSNFQIENWSAKLKQYSHAEDKLKQEHIRQIQMKK